MAKFGRFAYAISQPKDEFEGDYMQRDGDYVDIKRKVGALPNENDPLVATISLNKGESVRKISD